MRKNKRTDLAALARLAAEHEVHLFLIGNPLHMSGDVGRQADWVKEFADALSSTRESRSGSGTSG